MGGERIGEMEQEKRTEVIPIRFTPSMVQRIEEQQKREQRWSRSEMIRLLVERALDAEELKI